LNKTGKKDLSLERRKQNEKIFQFTNIFDSYFETQKFQIITQERETNCIFEFSKWSRTIVFEVYYLSGTQ
jgi:hypothetical protein